MIPHPLKVAREQHGWSQAKLAELLGVSTRTVSRWEKYETLPYPFYRERLCSLFDKNASELGLLELNHPPPIAVSPTASNHDDYNDQQTDITSGKIENQSEKPFFSETRRRRRFKQVTPIDARVAPIVSTSAGSIIQHLRPSIKAIIAVPSSPTRSRTWFPAQPIPFACILRKPTGLNPVNGFSM